METTVTIPSTDRTQTVTAILLKPGSTTVYVTVADSDGTIERMEIDISAEWAAASTENKTIIKAFIKILAALGLDAFNQNNGIDVTSANVTGEVWD